MCARCRKQFDFKNIIGYHDENVSKKCISKREDLLRADRDHARVIAMCVDSGALR